MQELIRSRIYSVLAENRTQIFLLTPVFMGMGIAVYFSLRFEPPFYLGAGLAALCLVGVWLTRSRDALRIAVLFLLCGSLGFMAAQIRTSLMHSPILEREIKTTGLEGLILEVENLGLEQGQRIVLGDLSIERLAPEDTPRRIRIKIRKDQDLQTGQRVSVLAGLNPPAPPAYPGGFDFQRYMYFKGIGAIGFSYGRVEVLEPARLSGFAMRVEGLRAHVGERILQVLVPEQAGVSAALIVGQRGAISEEDQEAMRASGLAHMLAISGLHIGLFSGVVFFFLRLLLVSVPYCALNWPVKKIAALAGIAAAVFYMVLAGSTIPTQRATLMSGIVLFAILLDRTPLSMRLVAFAAVCVLAIAPESLMSPSFQMSFSAVAGLVAFYEWAAPWLRAQYRQSGVLRRVGLYVAGVFATTVIATFATAPFALFHFQQLALYGVLANILAMPVLTFIVMPLCVLAYALMPFGLEGWVLPIIGHGVDLILKIAHFVAGLEHASLKPAALSFAAFMFFVGGVLVLVLLRGFARGLSLGFFVAAGLALLVQVQSIMLISSDLNLVAYRDRGGAFYVTNTRKDKFTRGIWERRFGLEEGAGVLWPKEGQAGDAACGEGGCRIETPEYKISVIEQEQALAEECGWADLVIVRKGYDLKCGDQDSPKVIDRKNAKAEGPFGVYIGGPLTLRSVQAERGVRPWVAGTARFNGKSASD